MPMNKCLDVSRTRYRCVYSTHCCVCLGVCAWVAHTLKYAIKYMLYRSLQYTARNRQYICVEVYSKVLT